MLGRRPRLPLDQALAPLRSHEPAEGRVPAAHSFLERFKLLWQQAAAAQRKAQEEQKRYADRHRREETFQVGDLVLLSTKDLVLADTADSKRAAKLGARFVGPFPVEQVINDNAYKLSFPPQLERIHPVQNITKLRRYKQSPDRFIGRPQPNNRPPPVAVDPAGQEEYEVERILAERRTGRGGRSLEYLVKWLNYPNEDCSWVKLKDLNCPDLLAEFKARNEDDEDS
jgi:hypothetical protein